MAISSAAGTPASGAGPVGGGIGAVTAGGNSKPAVLQLQSNHGLADRTRVRCGPPATNGSPLLFYAKCSGYHENELGLYLDSSLKTPVEQSGVNAGMEVVRLAVEDYALVAGINFYTSYPALEGAVGDARRFAQWLKGTAYLPDDQVFEVEAFEKDAKPWIEDVKSKFEKLALLADDEYYLGRRLYIFLSGHGILPVGGDHQDFGESALLMANVVSRTIANHVAGRSWAEIFRHFGVFDEVVLLMDCCRDTKGVPMTGPSVNFDKRKRPEGRKFYAMATQPDSQSREKKFGASNEVQGIFTHVLMEALASPALCDEDGALTGEILAARLAADVYKENKNQIPKPEFDPGFVFLKRPAPSKPKVCIRFDASVAGQTFDIRGGKYYANPLTRVASAEPWTEELPPSFYQLKSRETGNAKVIELDGTQEVKNVDFP